jgi:hypothetical protein
MTYTITLDTDPPLTERERENWIWFLRDLADSLERREDKHLDESRRGQRLAFTGGGADAWRQHFYAHMGQCR